MTHNEKRPTPNPDLSRPNAELGGNLLGPEPTLLPAELDEGAKRSQQAGDDVRDIAARFPKSPLAWALLAHEADADGDHIGAYAYARVGYHRGLDALRKAGWRGAGPIPSSHEPNQGFLRCLVTLAHAAERIAETDEVERISTFIQESDPTLI